MTRARQVLVAMAALAAGVATAGVGVGTAGHGPQTITINGSPSVSERAGGDYTLTIIGSAQSVVTVDARSGSAQRGTDFDFQRAVYTITADEAGRNLATVAVSVFDDEADEPAEDFAITACTADAAGADCGQTDFEHEATHVTTIEDDDGALDAAVCSGQLRPVGLLLGRLQVAGLFEGCS